MFEDSTRQQVTWRRSAWPLAFSVLLHLGALVALVVAGARTPAPGAGERPIDVLFLGAAINDAGSAGNAGEAPAAAAAPAERRAARQRQAMLDRLVQPTVVPDAGPAAAATTSAAAGQETLAEPGPAAGDADLPVEAGGSVVNPEIIESSRVKPAYPEAALRAGQEGLVVLEVAIDEHGRVADVKVVRGLGHDLDEAAVAAVRQWRYRPATRYGKPIRVRGLISVTFEPQP